MLYLIATPIGNLEDITLRALRVLKEVDYILCEDTRHSKGLLYHYSITTPCYAYHKFNERSKCDQILNDLDEGRNIALISDAGMPGIMDPGALLVQEARKKGLPITVLPGPSSLICALALSGLSDPPFHFIGYIDRSCHKAVAKALTEPVTTVAFVAPHDLVKLLSLFPPEHPLCLVRELTKIHEEVLSMTASEMLEHYLLHAVRGEMILLFKGTPPVETSLNPIKILIEEFALSRPQAKKIANRLKIFLPNAIVSDKTAE